MDSKIIVVIRKRPLGKKELAKGDQDIVEVRDYQSVIVKEIKQKVDLTKYVEEHNFNFDLAIDTGVSNEEIYIKAVRPILEAAFNKYRVTCFAYGQTGSGKTYTMLGDPDENVPGLYLLASHDLFAILQQPQYANLYVVISFYEIYCGKLFDLLNGRSQLQSREDAKGTVNIIGLTEKKITNVQQLMQVITNGQNQRVTGSNSANSESSRSHALLQISLKMGKQIHGKLSFIDLAGSERGADVQDQNKQTRIDGAEINKSLLALKECIRAIDLNKNHTPFRGSKLTQVLKDSFTGKCKTVMIGNISPSNASSEHTLNTLRYADRVKELKKGADSKGMTQEEIMARELMLARQQNNVIKKVYKNPDDDDDEEDISPPYNQKMNQGQQGINQSNISGKNNMPSNNNNFGINNQLYQQQQMQPQPYPQYQQQLYPQQQNYQQQYQQNQIGYPPQQQQFPQQGNLQNANRINSFQDQNQSQNQQQMNKANSVQYQGQQNNMQSYIQQQNTKNPSQQQQQQNYGINSQQFGQNFNQQSFPNQPPNQNNKKSPQLPPTSQPTKQQVYQQQNFNIQPINQQQFPQYQQPPIPQKQPIVNIKGLPQQQIPSQQELNQMQDQDDLSAQSIEDINLDDEDLMDQNINSNSDSQDGSLQNYYNQQAPSLNQFIAEGPPQEFSKQSLPQLQKQQFAPFNQPIEQPSQNPPQPQLNQFPNQQPFNQYPQQQFLIQQNQFPAPQQNPNYQQQFSQSQQISNPQAYQIQLQRQQEYQQKQEQLKLLTQKHEILVQKILENEEDVISKHRDHIDVMVNLTKQDMLLLNQIENPGSDISLYIGSLNKLLDEKLSQINKLKTRVSTFQDLLNQEVTLSSQFYNQRQQMLLEMKSGEESQLLENI